MGTEHEHGGVVGDEKVPLRFAFIALAAHPYAFTTIEFVSEFSAPPTPIWGGR
jgi:hypothetical protein